MNAPGEQAARSADAATHDAGDVLASMTERLGRDVRPYLDATRTLATLIAEATPFVESARGATAEGGDPSATVAWREARSFAWLLAYRLGDQGWPAHAAAAVVPAWREAAGESSWVRDAADEVSALMLEGFSRGREDHARAEAQRGLADALLVAEVAPRVVVIVAAGALDPDSARSLADRASAFLLRRDARAALLDVEGLVSPTAAVLAELWSIPSAARMLGVRMVVSGVNGLVGEAVRAANLHDEGEIRLEKLGQGVEALLREAGVALGGPRGFGAWLRALLAPRDDASR